MNVGGAMCAGVVSGVEDVDEGGETDMSWNKQAESSDVVHQKLIEAYKDNLAEDANLDLANTTCATPETKKGL